MIKAFTIKWHWSTVFRIFNQTSRRHVSLTQPDHSILTPEYITVQSIGLWPLSLCESKKMLCAWVKWTQRLFCKGVVNLAINHNYVIKPNLISQWCEISKAVCFIFIYGTLSQLMWYLCSDTAIIVVTYSMNFIKWCDISFLTLI